MSVLITEAVPEDAKEMLDFLRIVGAETDNLSFGAEGLEICVEDEAKYLASLNEAANSVMLVAKKDGIIVGTASFIAITNARMKHRGELAVSVVKREWGNGIGSELLKEVINFARTNAQAEIISLEVRSDNFRAIKLYEKYGFRKIGHFIGFFKINDKYVDFDLMNLYL